LEESNDKTWIVSAQSPIQQELLEKLPADKPIFVEGSFRVWLRGAAVNYFVLRADPTPEPVQLHASHLDGNIFIAMYKYIQLILKFFYNKP
jgi:signaling intermediate in Toll pathway protein